MSGEAPLAATMPLPLKVVPQTQSSWTTYDSSIVPPPTLTQRVQSTDIVECRVSVLGVAIMIWGRMPQNSTKDPLGEGET